MQHSLLSRFQGCLLGMVLGERLAQQSGSGEDSQTVLDCFVQIIEAGQWRDPLGERSIRKALKTVNPAVAVLPATLFFHEDLFKQRRLVLQLLKASSINEQVQGAVIAFAYAIAEALKNQLNPATFLAQLAAYLRLAELPTGAQAKRSGYLEQLQAILEAGGTGYNLSAQPLREPHAQTILLALGLFLSTPENLSLSLLRAARLSNQPTSICALVGALSGAYNGIIGIPPLWIATLEPKNGDQPAIAVDVQSLNTLAAQLLAVWSGVYDLANYDQSTLPTSALTVAAPWVTRLH
jgi:ADP-ribosylglycohydrolase